MSIVSAVARRARLLRGDGEHFPGGGGRVVVARLGGAFGGACVPGGFSVGRGQLDGQGGRPRVAGATAAVEDLGVDDRGARALRTSGGVCRLRAGGVGLQTRVYANHEDLDTKTDVRRVEETWTKVARAKSTRGDRATGARIL